MSKKSAEKVGKEITDSWLKENGFGLFDWEMDEAEALSIDQSWAKWWSRPLTGGDIEPELAFKMLLYSYCKKFQINPMEAQHTPLSLMLEMLYIHGETEAFKVEQVEKKARK